MAMTQSCPYSNSGSVANNDNAAAKLRTTQPPQAGKQRFKRKPHASRELKDELPVVSSDSHLADVLSEILATISRLGGSISTDVSFMEAGIDSLGELFQACSVYLATCVYFEMSVSAGAVQMRNDLSKLFDIELPSTVMFDYPTPHTLAKYIVQAGRRSVPDYDRRANHPPKSSEPPASTETDSSQVCHETAVETVMAEVAAVVTNILGMAVSSTEPLMAAGLDSLGKFLY